MQMFLDALSAFKAVGNALPTGAPHFRHRCCSTGGEVISDLDAVPSDASFLQIHLPGRNFRSIEGIQAHSNTATGRAIRLIGPILGPLRVSIRTRIVKSKIA